ncbi:MAG: thioesterase family protein [Sterolibacterium sp.]
MVDIKQSLDIDEPRLAAILRDFLEERVPFNKLLGLQIVSLDPQAPVLRFDMRPDLVGNSLLGVLHGGVIATALDVSCGVSVVLSVMEKHIHKGESFEAQLERISRIGTVDLRIDYLQPGLGKWFLAKAEVMRSGNRVVAVRSELRNDSAELIALAVGAFTIG